ncbi:hypothetical protein RHMOL_Rhmol05G0023800 [Rhododendron molle]|uniref:Uncharacterized protein n=1 Tax=Rhododendron molle TaxID=49168 RepID=A0ACC0NJK7_RHOML|nr:hypothetical protein RHMOL_Rhmol05G0023800 [Rhododendron molle]
MTRVFWSTKLTGALLIFKMLCPGGGFWLVSTADFSPLLFFFFCVDRRRVLSKLLPSKAVAGFGMEISPFVFPALFSFPYTYAAVGTVPQRWVSLCSEVGICWVVVGNFFLFFCVRRLLALSLSEVSVS